MKQARERADRMYPWGNLHFGDRMDVAPSNQPMPENPLALLRKKQQEGGGQL